MRALLVTVSLLAGLSPAVAEPLLIEYRDKPPYSYTQDGRPAGLLIDRATLILRRAGLDARFAEVPIRRTLLNLKNSDRLMCSVGLYKLPERAAYSRYSLPIYRDRPHVVLAHTNAAARIRAKPSLKALFADAELTVGMLDGVSYGPELDRALAQAANPAGHAQRTPLQLARMVAAQRVDYMLIDDADYGWLRQDPQFAGTALERIEFADMPAGEQRYFACSRKLPRPTLERINAAIRSLQPELQLP